MTLISILIGMSVGLAVLAGGLVMFGRRGKRINDHPVCRRCGFDLIGHDPRPPRCPECGAELTKVRAVRTGARRRRTVPYIAGLLLGAMLVVGIGFGALNFKRLNAPGFKPVWLLLIEARSRDEPTVDAAVQELCRRWSADLLSEAALDRFKPIIVDLQSSPERPWSYWRLAALMWLFEADRITDEDYERMAPHALRMEPRARQAIPVGGSWDIRMSPAKGQDRTTAGWQPRWNAENGQIRWIGLPAEEQPAFSASRFGFISTQAPATPGEYEVELTYRAHLTTPMSGDVVQRRPSKEWTETHRLKVTVLPEGTEDIRKISGPEIDAEVRASIRTPRIKVSPSNGVMTMRFELPVEYAPVDMGLTGEIVQGDRRWPLMKFPVEQGSSIVIPYPRAVEGMELAPVTVVVRGSVDVARSFPKFTESWVGEIVFEHVMPEFEPAPQ